MRKRKKNTKRKITNKQFLGLFIVGFGGAIAISVLLGTSATLPNYLKSQAVPTGGVTNVCAPTNNTLIDTVSNNSRITGSIADSLGAAKNNAIDKMEQAIKDECKAFSTRDNLALVCPQAETACPACEPNVGSPNHDVTCSAGTIRRNPRSLTADNWDITTYESQEEKDNSYIASLKDATFSASCLCRASCRRIIPPTTFTKGSNDPQCSPGRANYPTSQVSGSSAAEYPQGAEAEHDTSYWRNEARKVVQDAAKADAAEKLQACPGDKPDHNDPCGFGCRFDSDKNPNPAIVPEGKVTCARIYSSPIIVAAGKLPRYRGTAVGCLRTCDMLTYCKDASPPPITTPSTSTAGDSNNDGIFNSSDLVQAHTAGLYDTGQPATLAQGDWNGDGEFDSSDLVFVFQAGTYDTGAAALQADWDNLFTPSTPINSNAIDFNNQTLLPFAVGQDVSGSATKEDGGRTLHLSGNTWKRIDIPTTLTSNSTLDFDFKGPLKGEVHGIGFSENNTISAARTFRLFGTQVWGIANYLVSDASASNWQHFSIPVGQHFTGNMTSIFFAMDNDATRTGDSYFRDVVINSSASAPPPPPPPPPPTSNVIDFNNQTLLPFAVGQDVSGSATKEDGGRTLHLSGNTWKRIDMPITVTPSTTLEFDFKGPLKGEVHGIGLSETNGIKSTRTFRIFGTQSWGISNYLVNDSSALNWQHISIPIGQHFTGNMTNIHFAMDNDASGTGDSYFRDVELKQ